MEEQVLEEIKIYCQYHRSEISSEQCIKSFTTGNIIRGFCLRRKCESPAKPCITCVEQEVSQPEDKNAGYFFAEKGSEQCPFHNKNGKDANPETEFLKTVVSVEETEEPAIETKEIKQGGEEIMKKGDIVTIKVSKITFKKERKPFRKMDGLVEKVKSGNYEPIRVKDMGDETYRASTSSTNYNERVVEAIKLAGLNTILAIISKRGRHRETDTAPKPEKKVSAAVTEPKTDAVEYLFNLTPAELRSALQEKFAGQLDAVVKTLHSLANEAVKMKEKIKQ